MMHDPGTFQEALKAYGHALCLDPANKQIWNNNGLIERRLGQSDAAYISFQKAIELDNHYFHDCIISGLYCSTRNGMQNLPGLLKRHWHSNLMIPEP
jgi:tetratricopeptide (TPR) repeat protein